jgi:Clostridial binary toxin B/anthrax toxin PA Ca-binding domain
MLLIGLLLVLAAVAAGGAVTYDGAETTRVEFFNHTATMSVSAIFFAGVLTMAVFFLGIWAMAASMRHARGRRLARREARAEHRDSVRSLEDERAQLAEENARLEQALADRRTGTTAAAAGTGAVAGSTVAGRDRDGDGVPDSQERGFFDRDSDDDGVPDSRERHGLFSRRRDRDADGIPDSQETTLGTHRADGAP